MSTDAIMTRLQKVQALTESPNVHEAAAAAAKLQELLFAYNLELADIDPGDDSGATRDYDKVDYDLRHLETWRRTLLTSVARSNFCRMVYMAGTSKCWLVGEKHNVDSVLMIYEYLIETIARLRNAAWKTEKHYATVSADVWKRSFAVGATNEIGKRLAAQLAESKEADERSTALVVDVESELKGAMAEYFPQTQKPRRQTYAADATAYAAGAKAGQSISLNRQLGGE